MRIIRGLACFLFYGLLILFFSACGGGGGGEDSPPHPPTATTTAATEISLHTATLNGTVNPHAQVTNAWLEWGTDNALASPAVTAAQAIGAGTTDQSVGATITGLTLGTTYYYRIAAANASGTQKGTIASFTTALPNSPPSLTTDAATSVTVSGAVLNGTVSPNELDTTAVFEWGTDSNPATFTSTPSQSLGAGTTSVAITASLSGLTPGVTYYFRVAATNPAGTTKGSIVSFLTVAQAPTAATAAVTAITTSGATLNGTVNPNGLATDAYFEYGTDSALAGPSTTSTQAMGSGASPLSYSRSISGLSPYTTYYFRAAASNSNGTQKGVINSFLTGETYIAVGDSITRGSHDDIPADGIGYDPILGNLLGVMIANAGVSGDSSADGAAAIDNTIAAYPSADYYLILYGSNDASLPVPKATYKANMQTIIDKIKAAGKTPFLAKVPYATVPGFNDASIQEYNAAIDELKIANGLPVIPPDFYAWFNSRPDQLADGLHPNGTGYQSMANLWFNALP